jgi:hypothetical protein
MRCLCAGREVTSCNDGLYRGDGVGDFNGIASEWGSANVVLCGDAGEIIVVSLLESATPTVNNKDIMWSNNCLLQFNTPSSEEPLLPLFPTGAKFLSGLLAAEAARASARSWADLGLLRGKVHISQSSKSSAFKKLHPGQDHWPAGPATSRRLRYGA